MRSFMKEYNTAPLTPDARVKIFAEALKLFGGPRGRRPPAPPADKPKASPAAKADDAETSQVAKTPQVEVKK